MDDLRASDLAWLSGDWEFTRDGRHVTEHWSAPEADTVIGYSRSVKEGQLVEFEHLLIKPGQNGVLEYVAKPSGQDEATFTLVSFGTRSLVFENKDHDFPQRITYSLEDDRLTAAIEGTLNAHPRRVEFPYRRVRP